MVEVKGGGDGGERWKWCGVVKGGGGGEGWWGE